MRISDWSSDVCASDLTVDGNVVAIRSWLVLDREAKKLLSETQFYTWGALVTALLETRGTSFDKQAILLLQSETISLPTFMKVTGMTLQEIGRVSCRERVCQYV